MSFYNMAGIAVRYKTRNSKGNESIKYLKKMIYPKIIPESESHVNEDNAKAAELLKKLINLKNMEKDGVNIKNLQALNGNENLYDKKVVDFYISLYADDDSAENIQLPFKKPIDSTYRDFFRNVLDCDEEDAWNIFDTEYPRSITSDWHRMKIEYILKLDVKFPISYHCNEPVTSEIMEEIGLNETDLYMIAKMNMRHYDVNDIVIYPVKNEKVISKNDYMFFLRSKNPTEDISGFLIINDL